MALDRGTLAKIDRRILSDLDHTNSVQLVKVPLSDAVWSTWRRYCETVGLSMGQGIAALIAHELGTVVAEASGGGAVLAERAERRAAAREEGLEARKYELEAREGRLRAREQQLRAQKQRIRAQTSQSGPHESRLKIGRNERCPCASGLKYKHCHGLPGAPT